ncbi:MAG TPA: alpha/beta hydrolase-fold protein [Vicinamibacterales bacterium]|nr:alpha/beta hydrolase-fold protein [Vicinamibacterales bacterium]
MRSLASLPLVIVAALAVPTGLLQAQVATPPAGAPGPQGATGRAGGAVPNLTAAEPMGPPENLDTYPVPPEGFNVVRDNIPHGEVRLVEYDSKTLGIRRPLRLYLPPGYTTARKYPVLYLQHGLGNTSTEWTQRARAPIIADNLIADGKMVPAIIVFPSGNATATPGDEKQGDRTQASYGQPYHDDLLKEIIPFVDANYPTHADRANRGLAGMSMGSGQALNIALANLDRFAWLAVVAPAPNTRPPAELMPDPTALKQLKLFWLSVGNRDALYRVAQGVHTYATEKGVVHVWRVDTNAHDTAAMSANFYHFAQKLFKE